MYQTGTGGRDLTHPPTASTPVCKEGKSHSAENIQNKYRKQRKKKALSLCRLPSSRPPHPVLVRFRCPGPGGSGSRRLEKDLWNAGGQLWFWTNPQISALPQHPVPSPVSSPVPWDSAANLPRWIMSLHEALKAMVVHNWGYQRFHKHLLLGQMFN